MGKLRLTDAEILRRLLLGDTAFFAQQRDNTVKFDPHDLYILFRGVVLALTPSRSGAPCIFSTRCIL